MIFHRRNRIVKPWPKPPLGLAARKRQRRRHIKLLVALLALTALFVGMAVFGGP